MEGVLPLSDESATGDHILIKGVELELMSVPLYKVFLKSDLISGYVNVEIRSDLAVKGVSLLLGNDLAGDKVMINPCVSSHPCSLDDTDAKMQDTPGLYPVCAVTRAMTKKQLTTTPNAQNEESKSDMKSQPSSSSAAEDPPNLTNIFRTHMDESTDNSVGKSPMYVEGSEKTPTSREQLIQAQANAPELTPLLQDALDMAEAGKVPTCFYKKSGILMRKWRRATAPSDEEWQVSHQIVVPKCLRNDVLSLAHSSPLAGHLGVNKTYRKVLSHFYWPGLKGDVVKYCRSCHTCQVVGKPNQKPNSAPLKPILAIEEPFSRVLIDCVGPLPITKSGNKYLLSIMCVTTRFPEAVPVRNIKTPTIIKALMKFFTFVGLPRYVQSDQGSNFMSGIFQQVMHQLGIAQCKSSAYHPQLQGAVERFHQMLKTMMRRYCFDCDKNWDEGVHLLMFAVRESIQDSLGFSPFELVFGHSVRGPLKLLKEAWMSDEEEPSINLLDYVSEFRLRLFQACEVAKQNLQHAQTRMKVWYDKRSRGRSFKPGDKVLALLPLSGHPF